MTGEPENAFGASSWIASEDHILGRVGFAESGLGGFVPAHLLALFV